MGQIYELIGFAVLWTVAGIACAAPLTFLYLRLLHERFGVLGGKNKRQLSIASWHESVLSKKGVRQSWQVDDYPFAWLRGLSYRMPWSGRSLVLIIGATEKARFHNLTGKRHPREESPK